MLGASATYPNLFIVFEYQNIQILFRCLFDLNTDVELELHTAYKKHMFTPSDRTKIALGVANGLGYLHSTLPSKPPILHLDIKSSNVMVCCNAHTLY